MTGVLNKLAGRRAAIRRLCVVLALALIGTLSLDLNHHALHAGQGHGSAMAIVTASSDVASYHGSDLSGPSSDQQRDWHAGPGGGSCDCCATSCFFLFAADLPKLASPNLRPTVAEHRAAAILSRRPPSLDRPPIANL